MIQEHEYYEEEALEAILEDFYHRGYSTASKMIVECIYLYIDSRIYL